MRFAKRFRRAALVAAGAALGTLAAACTSSEDSDGGALSCPDLSSRIFGDSVGEGFYRVISPNGGEAFRLGDSLRVRVTSGPSDSEAVLYLAITRNGNTSSVVLPGTPPNSIDTRNRCDWSFRIPDSLRLTSGKMGSLVSDSLRIRVAKYNQESLFSDYSDGFFRITE